MPFVFQEWSFTNPRPMGRKGTSALTSVDPLRESVVQYADLIHAGNHSVTLSTVTPRGSAYPRNDGGTNTCHSERTSPRESRRIPRGLDGLSSFQHPSCFGGPFDSLGGTRSLRVTVGCHWERTCPTRESKGPPKSSQSIFISALPLFGGLFDSLRSLPKNKWSWGRHGQLDRQGRQARQGHRKVRFWSSHSDTCQCFS